MVKLVGKVKNKERKKWFLTMKMGSGSLFFGMRVYNSILTFKPGAK